MPKDIKVKEKDSQFIRRLDRRIAFTSRVKGGLKKQFDELKQDKNNKEDSDGTNYAIDKIMRTGDEGARKSTYVITGVSKSAYRKARMKIAEKQEEKRNELEIDNNVENNIPNCNIRNKRTNHNNVNGNSSKLNAIKTREFNNDKKTTTNETAIIKKYQKQKLIKEKQNYKNIKLNNSKSITNNANSKSFKIKTRDYLNNKFNQDKAKVKVHTLTDLMQKSKLQNLKQSSIKVKNVAQKTEKTVIKVGKKVVQRTKRNRSINCFRKWYGFNDDYHYYINSRNVWLCLWFFIF